MEVWLNIVYFTHSFDFEQANVYSVLGMHSYYNYKLLFNRQMYKWTILTNDMHILYAKWLKWYSGTLTHKTCQIFEIPYAFTSVIDYICFTTVNNVN